MSGNEDEFRAVNRSRKKNNKKSEVTGDSVSIASDDSSASTMNWSITDSMDHRSDGASASAPFSFLKPDAPRIKRSRPATPPPNDPPVNVLTSNRYQLLGGSNALSKSKSAAKGPKPQAQPNRAPPITITAPPCSQLYELVNTLSKGHRFMAHRNELLVLQSSVDEYKSIVNGLRESKVPFFTHPLKLVKSFKSVLYSIPLLPLADIEKELNELNVPPLSVSYLLTKDERDRGVRQEDLAGSACEHMRSYLIEFMNEKASRDFVHSIRFIGQHACKWRTFQTGNGGPTLCRRCCSFGHGQMSCGRDPVCALCAGKHLTDECTMSLRSDAQKRFCCVNCVSNKLKAHHRASDLECPSRELYAARRKSANEARSRRPTASNASQTFAPTPMRANKPAAPNAPKVRAPPHPAATRSTSYAKAVSGSHTWSTAPGPNKQSLFSIDECADLLFTAIDDLQRCHSRLDQLKVLTSLLQQCLV